MTERVSLFEALAERRFVMILGAVLGAVGLYYLYWSHAADEVKARWDRVVAQAAAHGVTIQAAHVETGGFPYRLELRVEGALIRSGTLTWRIDHLVAHTLPYRQTHWIVDTTGDLHFDLGAETATLNSADARASYVEDDPEAPRLAIDVKEPVLGDLSAKRFQYHAREETGGAGEAIVQIDGVRVAEMGLEPIDLMANIDTRRAANGDLDGKLTVSATGNQRTIDYLTVMARLDPALAVQEGNRVTFSFRIDKSRLLSGDRLLLDSVRGWMP